MAVKESSDELNPAVPIAAEKVAPKTTRTAGDYLALAIATCGVGYFPIAPGTLGALVGVGLYLTIWSGLDQLLTSRALANRLTTLYVFTPLMAFMLLVILLVTLIGIWAASRTEKVQQKKDPSIVVIDEVAGQHITLILPLIPIAVPNLAAHMDFSTYAIFSALSMLNWKYLLAGFILFRLFDIWKPFPIRNLEKLPGGWGVMADDWLAGVYAAILLKVALHFGLFSFHLGSS